MVFRFNFSQAIRKNKNGGIRMKKYKVILFVAIAAILFTVSPELGGQIVTSDPNLGDID